MPFCFEIRSSAKDYATLLKIATNAALDNGKKIIDTLSKSSKLKATKPTMKSVLKECIDIYVVVVNEFSAMLEKPTSSLVDSDARVVNEEIRGCQSLLVTRKISEPLISNRSRIAGEYGALVEDLAYLV